MFWFFSFLCCLVLLQLSWVFTSLLMWIAYNKIERCTQFSFEILFSSCICVYVYQMIASCYFAKNVFILFSFASDSVRSSQCEKKVRKKCINKQWNEWTNEKKVMIIIISINYTCFRSQPKIETAGLVAGGFLFSLTFRQNEQLNEKQNEWRWQRKNWRK